MNPEELVKIPQAGYAAFLAGDMEGVLALLDDEVEWITPGVGVVPTAGDRRGKAAVMDFFRIVAETWDFNRFEPRDYIAHGDRVAVVGHYSARSRKTGRNAACDWVMVWRVRNGKVVHFQEYTETAILAAAVAEQGSAHRA